MPTRIATIAPTTIQNPVMVCSPGTCEFIPQMLASRVRGKTMTLI